MTLNIAANTGPPKIRKNESKKNKKSWRKNVDMTEVEEFLEEQRFEERIGGSLSLKKDQDIFMLDTGGEEPGQKRRKRKEIKPLKCHSLLNGLPGVPDPKPLRNRTRTLAERMNPVVKRKLKTMVEAGVVSKKMKGALANRAEYIARRRDTEQERKTRRRTKFDFDLWDEDKAASNDGQKPEDSWLTEETKTHTSIWTNNLVPKEGKNRKCSSGTLLPAVELPHPGQSYNPALADHQDILWKAAMVEMKKEKEEKRLERQTTAMFPTRENAPTEKTYLLEMSEGIAELGGQVDNEEEEDGEDKEEQDTQEKGDIKSAKPKTRKQRRDQKVRAREERKLKSLMKGKQKENQVFLIKSIKKALKVQDEVTKVRQKKKEENEIEKKMNPIQHSRYKYEAPEIEIKLSDELTGNLRNLKPEGSILEDRYKSLQRRNIVETRVVQKAARMRSKKVDKRSHLMGWEDQLRKTKQGRRHKKKKNKKSAS